MCLPAPEATFVTGNPCPAPNVATQVSRGESGPSACRPELSRSLPNRGPVRFVECDYISCYDGYVKARKVPFTIRELQDLAEFRFQIRRFLRFSEEQSE